MVVNIIVALLAYFLAGAIPIIEKGLVAFLIWLVILFFLVGFIPSPQVAPGQRRWLW